MTLSFSSPASQTIAAVVFGAMATLFSILTVWQAYKVSRRRSIYRQAARDAEPDRKRESFHTLISIKRLLIENSR